MLASLVSCSVQFPNTGEGRVFQHCRLVEIYVPWERETFSRGRDFVFVLQAVLLIVAAFVVPGSEFKLNHEEIFMVSELFPSFSCSDNGSILRQPTSVYPYTSHVFMNEIRARKFGRASVLPSIILFLLLLLPASNHRYQCEVILITEIAMAFPWLCIFPWYIPCSIFTL